MTMQRNLKRQVVEGIPANIPDKARTRKSPCMIEFEGKMVPTCEVYGHLFINGKCYRCDQLEKS